MLSQFGIEASQAMQFAIAFCIFFVLLALFIFVGRRLKGGRLLLPGQDRGRARQPRLGIVDIYDLDRQRQLILLRRDNVEHLLLIGGPNDVVVETNIVRVPGARLPTPSATETVVERAEPTFDRPAEAHRPQLDAAGSRGSLEAQLAARLGHPAPNRPSETSDAREELAPVGIAAASVPARVEPVLKPDVVAPAPRPAGPPLRPEPPLRTSPSPRQAPAALGEAPAARPAPIPPNVTELPTRAAPVAPRVQDPPRPEPRPAPAAEPRRGDAMLSDMARQLEEALRRPAAPAGPASGAPPNAGREAPPANPERPEPAGAAPGPEGGEAPRPAQPVHRAPPPASAPAPAAPPRPTPPPRVVEDPFSVEEIEAEFARLLGRPAGADRPSGEKT